MLNDISPRGEVSQVIKTWSTEENCHLFKNDGMLKTIVRKARVLGVVETLRIRKVERLRIRKVIKPKIVVNR